MESTFLSLILGGGAIYSFVMGALAISFILILLLLILEALSMINEPKP